MQRRLGTPVEDTAPIPHVGEGRPGPAHTSPRHAPEPSPVFVDASGRRQRRVRRTGRLLVIPAAAYVVLLISTLMGGPTVRSPLLPAAPAPHTPEPEASSAATSSPGPSRRSSAGEGLSPTPSAARTPSKAATAGGRTPAPGQTGLPVIAPTAGTTPGNGAAPPAANTGHGRPTSAPGQGGGKPTSHP
nr:hypothetical protein OG409_10680 [Streptomyces sp. NBC_00974]